MKSRRKSTGQSLVEFALTLPLVLLLVFTFLDLGRAVYYKSVLNNAVREGARYASVRKEVTSEEVVDYMDSYSVAEQFSYPNPAFTYDGDYVTVSASYEFSPITPFLAQLLGEGNTLMLTAESTMLLAPIARQ